MKKYNKKIATIMAAVLCGLALMTGIGSIAAETAAQPKATAVVMEGSADNADVLPDEDAYVMRTNIEGCDTFTQIVDKLEAGKGYANVTLDGTEVLLVSTTVLDYDNIKPAVEAEVFVYFDEMPRYLGHVRSGGSATPLALKDGKLYSVGHHFVRKSTVTDGKLVTMEVAYETFDQNGNATYHYGSDDGGNYEGVGDEAIFDSLNAEYLEAELIGFTTVG